MRWYDTQHLYSAMRFVTPDDQHAGRDTALPRARRVTRHATSIVTLTAAATGS